MNISDICHDRTPEIRENGVKELYDYVRDKTLYSNLSNLPQVQSWLATHPPESAPQIWNEVYQSILFPLTSQSSSTYERLGGIAAMGQSKHGF